MVGIAGRYLGAWLGVTLARVPRVNRNLISIAHTPGGMMEIVVALLALEAGLITQAIFVAIVFSAVFSSVIMGPWMTRALARRRRVSPVQFLDERALVLQLPNEGRAEALRLLAAKVAALTSPIAAHSIAQLALAREKEFGTGIGHGVAIPHVRLEHLRNPILAYGHSPEGLDWDAPDAEPVHHVFFLASATGAEDIHVQILAQIAKALSNSENRVRISMAQDSLEMYETLKGVLAPLPQA